MQTHTWVEARLACIPHPRGTCDRHPQRGRWNHVEGNMRWSRALHVERRGAIVHAVVLRDSRREDGPASVWRYQFDDDGEVLASTCMSSLPEEGAPLKGLRAPDSIADGRLRFRDSCSSYEYAARDFVPKGDRLGETLRLPPRGIGAYRDWGPPGPSYLQGVPREARGRLVELDFAPVVLPLERPPAKVSALSGSGWMAAPRVAELIHHRWSAAASYRPRSGEYPDDPACRGRSFVTSPDCQAAREQRSEEVRAWIRWLQDQAEKGEAEIRPIADGSDVTGHTVGLAPGGSMVLEVDGVPLLFEARRSAGLRVVFEGEASGRTTWAALRERLRREGSDEPVIAAPPYYLAGAKLFRLDEGGVQLLCSSLEQRDACNGKCNEQRRLGAEYADGSLFLPWAGGIKVGRCLDGKARK